MKKKQIISVFAILLLSALVHSLYDLAPSFLTSIISPVNESIWEHNKMILTAYTLWTIISMFIYPKQTYNIVFTNFITSLCCMFIVDLIFTPVYFYILKMQDNFPVTILIFTISIALAQVIGYYLLKRPYNRRLEFISIGLFIILFIIFTYLSYHPLDFKIFKVFN